MAYDVGMVWSESDSGGRVGMVNRSSIWGVKGWFFRDWVTSETVKGCDPGGWAFYVWLSHIVLGLALNPAHRTFSGRRQERVAVTRAGSLRLRGTGQKRRRAPARVAGWRHQKFGDLTARSKTLFGEGGMIRAVRPSASPSLGSSVLAQQQEVSRSRQ
ncbi:hypothetical protein NDU88_004744 [Pleurodeles waltl]|uniref:Uncharacterized protein n=1 Tax=Pleurodeles waltl TaxID=8319 RepID=A0AAV7T8S9_PLEWA|nr:hypothetical protein NDU88_004744 [Pleurodeles waltl]